jgi:hypothetical protein
MATPVAGLRSPWLAQPIRRGAQLAREHTIVAGNTGQAHDGPLPARRAASATLGRSRMRKPGAQRIGRTPEQNRTVRLTLHCRKMRKPLEVPAHATSIAEIT